MVAPLILDAQVRHVRPDPSNTERSCSTCPIPNRHRWFPSRRRPPRRRAWGDFVPAGRAAVDAALMAGRALAEARPGAPAQQALAALAASIFGERSAG
jgi:hypothetical protein